MSKITIPKKIRQQLGLKPGTGPEVSTAGGRGGKADHWRMRRRRDPAGFPTAAHASLHADRLLARGRG